MLLTTLLSCTAFAQSEQAKKTNEQDNDLELVKQCILNEAIGGKAEMTLAQLREKCSSLDESKQVTALDKRKAREQV
ncbi:phospholipase, partial [Shewanella algae]